MFRIQNLGLLLGDCQAGFINYFVYLLHVKLAFFLCLFIASSILQNKEDMWNSASSEKLSIVLFSQAKWSIIEN